MLEEPSLQVPPIVIRAKEQNVPNGFTILSAARGDQTGQSLEEQAWFFSCPDEGARRGADANNDNQITLVNYIPLCGQGGTAIGV